MQVSAVQDHVSHALITKNQAMDFTFDDSAHLAHILSTALYSNPRLAMLRETICNAWDAHIAAGITDKPISITLTSEYLLIRDFGSGISKDMIQPVYCVYGGSTKTNDSGVTGGFGLGCKSPWAYVNHFEVTSYCDGEGTIYKASKSSGELQGKPSLTPVISFPSEETGLAVKIEIQQRDHAYLTNAIMVLCFNGEIHADFNGEILKTLPLSTSKNGYLITGAPVSVDNQIHNLFVRYGNVIYPIEAHEAIRGDFDSVRSIIHHLPSQSHGLKWKLIIQAAPDSLSIMPSREGLSMSPNTVKTITDLLVNFQSMFHQNTHIGYAENILHKLHTKALEQENIFPELGKSTGYALISSDDKKQASYIDDCYSLNMAQVKGKLNDAMYKDITFKEFKWRFQRALKAGLLNKDKAKQFIRHLTTINTNPTEFWGYENVYIYPKWFYKSYVWPLKKAMEDNELVSFKNLRVLTDKSSRRYSNYSANKNEFLMIDEYHSILPINQINFLKPHIVLAHNQTDIRDFLFSNETMKKELMDSGDFLIYLVPRNTKKKQAVIDFFTERKYIIIDECRQVEKVSFDLQTHDGQPYVPKTRNTGIPTLAAVLKNNKPHHVSYQQVIGIGNEGRTREPKAVILHTKGNMRIDYLPQIPDQTVDFIIKKWGKDIGIVVTATQQSKYMKKGAEPLIDLLCRETLDYIKNNPSIMGLYATSLSHPKVFGHMSVYVRNDVICQVSPAYNDPEIKKHFRLHSHTNELDKHFYNLLQYLMTYQAGWLNRHFKDDFKTLVTDKFERIKPCQRMIRFAEEFRSNPILSGIEDNTYERIFSGDLEHQEHGRKLITTFIKAF